MDEKFWNLGFILFILIIKSRMASDTHFDLVIMNLFVENKVKFENTFKKL